MATRRVNPLTGKQRLNTTTYQHGLWNWKIMINKEKVKKIEELMQVKFDKEFSDDRTWHFCVLYDNGKLCRDYGFVIAVLYNGELELRKTEMSFTLEQLKKLLDILTKDKMI